MPCKVCGRHGHNARSCTKDLTTPPRLRAPASAAAKEVKVEPPPAPVRQRRTRKKMIPAQDVLPGLGDATRTVEDIMRERAMAVGRIRDIDAELLRRREEIDRAIGAAAEPAGSFSKVVVEKPEKKAALRSGRAVVVGAVESNVKQAEEVVT